MTTLTTNSTFTLNDEQQSALDAALRWLANPDASPYFVLEGYAGTGKTFTCKALVAQIKGRVCFTAPTNKAVKVLRETLTRDDYRPECATIYSLLGLQMVANGEVKELKAADRDDDDLDLAAYKLVVVDEGSMLNEVILKHIGMAANTFGVRFLFMGDPAQLPPVGEMQSQIWKMKSAYARLEKVMRHDNQVLELVTRIRHVVDHPAPTVSLKTNWDEAGGVKMLGIQFEQVMRQYASTGRFNEPAGAKTIAWRNLTVDRYNQMLRKVIFGADAPLFVVDDRVVYTGPAKDLDDRPMARTDDEGRVMGVGWQQHPVYPDFKAIRLSITLDDGKVTTAFALDPQDLNRWQREKNRLADQAKAMPRAWKDFWHFIESFHGVRHAYAITAHRAQGSTYRTVFVDYKDILVNRNRQEAYRCLYVACSRPTTELYLG